MTLPFSSLSLHLQFIWWGIIGVVVSMIWLVIHIDGAVTGFGNTLSGTAGMEELSTQLSATLGDLGSAPVGIHVIGYLGLISIVAGIGLFVRQKDQQRKSASR